MGDPEIGSRALLSVSDKIGLVGFAQELAKLSFELVSTGGTASALREAGLPVTDVADLTSFPEIMDGRVKTLHPAVHCGLLARRGVDDAVLREHDFRYIDLLAVNLYPFEAAVARQDCTVEAAIENIDVGGPAMLRAAAKNHDRVTVVSDPGDYDRIIEALRSGGVQPRLRRELAVKAFAHTARYDALIARYLSRQQPSAESFPETLVLSFTRAQTLRYGENPHQAGCLYRSGAPVPGTIPGARQLQGRPLSFNNIADADAALQCVTSFDQTACVIVKHANPCGAALAPTPLEAYEGAYATDPTSAFGGIIAFNRVIDAATAEAIVGRQLVDVVIAPEIQANARAALARKKNVRVLETGRRQYDAGAAEETWDLRGIDHGLLVQDRDAASSSDRDAEVVTRRQPTRAELADMRFAWTVAKFVKSNAIVYAKSLRTVGIGAGQMSRVLSARIGAMKAADEGLDLRGAAMASDAFLPFRDSIDTAAQSGVTSVIQPGGSVRDKEVVEAADEQGLAMIFTRVRHFRH